MMPKDPSKFKGDFSYYYIEDENGEIPKCYEGTISHIPLECIVENNIIKLFGKTSIYKSKCFDLKLNNHNYGMWFCVSSTNNNENIKNKILWRRAVDKSFLHNLFTPIKDPRDTKDSLLEINLHGDAPDVPNCPSSILTLNLKKEKRDFHVISVSLEISLSTYDLFILRFLE